MRRKQEDKSSESGSTIIGPSLSFKGEITGEEDLTVEGQVEGTIDLKKNHVTIGRTGRIKADIYGRSITIEGEVQGNLFGEERIALQQSGRVRGDMRAPAITIEDGAKFEGSIAMDSKDERQLTLRKFPLARNRNVLTKT